MRNAAGGSGSLAGWKSSWLSLGVGLLAAGLPLAALAQTAPAVPREPPSNVVTGVSVDRYIGDASKSRSSVVAGAMMSRVILSQGDPTRPGNPGAVLRIRKEISLGTMQPGEKTTLAGVEDQQVIYVAHGRGLLDDGRRAWKLEPGHAILIPANAAHRFRNSGDNELRLLVMKEPPSSGVTNGPGILVRDTAKLLYIENGAHWSNMSKAPFSDVGERFLLVYMGPNSIAGPHAHDSNTEEGWVKITSAPALLQIGSEIRPWTANMGIVAPPNGQTVHAAINTSNQVQAWFYFQGWLDTSGRPASTVAYPRDDPSFAAAEAAATVQPTALTE